MPIVTSSYLFANEGDYKINVKADVNGAIDELDETNNEKYITFHVIQPATTQPAEIITAVKEKVQCNFLNANTEQKCYSDDGKFACSGIANCIVDVSGQQGQQLHWKSSCGAEYYTKVDGLEERLDFKCEIAKTIQPIITPVVPENIYEEVICVFYNSKTTQQCSSQDGQFGCSGIDKCINKVYGQKGQTIQWKSSCQQQDYPPYIVIDGAPEQVWFNCESTATTATQVSPEEIYEEVTCDFAYSTATQECYSEDKRFSCSGKDRCVVKFYAKKGERITFKATCPGSGEALIDGVYQNAWFNCQNVAQAALPVPVVSPYVPVTEQVKCTFINPDPMLKHSCGTSGGSCTWIWDGITTEARDERMGPLLEKEINGEKVKYASCTADVIGENGETKTWRSVCGGEVNTIMDGANEEVEFKCLSDRQVSIEQLSGKGFRNAFWYCQGGAGVGLGNEETCKTADAWKKLAEEYCANSCHKTILGQEKCGLYSFSVSKECYFATEAERKAAQEMPITGEELKTREAAAPRMMTSIMIYSYLGECPECAELEREGDDSHDKLPIMVQDRAKTTDFRYADFNYKQFLDKYPNENVLLYLEIMSEASDPPKAYAKVYEKPGKVDDASTSEWFDMINSRTIQPVFDSLSSKVESRYEKPKQSLVYYYIGECPECPEMDKLKNRFGIVLHKENKEKMALPLAIVSSLESFLKEYQNEPILLLARFRGDSVNDLLIYARGGKADYASATQWIKDISRGKVEIAAIVGGIKETPVLEEGVFEVEVKKKTEKREEEIRKQLEKQRQVEEVIICKDSCPLGNKCYPFGYRKGGKFCSDEGAFKEQFKENTICENNFECFSNLCIDGKCISSGLIKKIMNWFRKLLGGQEAKEEITEILDCGASSDCMENAFKVCKPAKISQAGSVSEIIGLEGKKCVVKMTDGTEWMTCKFENYELGTKNLGYTPEKYCEGTLVKKLATATTASKMTRVEEPIPREARVSAQTEALSVCEKIRETGLKYKCMAMLKKDSSDCEMVDEPAKAYCYSDVALVTGDSAICEKIEDSGHREACKAFVEKASTKCSKWIYADYCYRDVAALTSDASICDQILYFGGKINCKAVALKDVSFCQNSDNEDCYQMLALLTGDEKVCDELKKMEAQQGERPIGISNFDTEVSKCIKMAKKEITGCLFESGSGVDCDLIPAMAKYPSLCENLKADYPGFSERDRCYFYSAMSLANLLPPELIVLRN